MHAVLTCVMSPSLFPEYNFVASESFASFQKRLTSYLPDGLTTDAPQYQKWWIAQVSQHQKETALLQLPSLRPDQAKQLQTLQTKRQEYTAKMSGRRYLPGVQPSLPAEQKPPPEDPVAKAARLQVLAGYPTSRSNHHHSRHAGLVLSLSSQCFCTRCKL